MYSRISDNCSMSSPICLKGKLGNVDGSQSPLCQGVTWERILSSEPLNDTMTVVGRKLCNKSNRLVRSGCCVSLQLPMEKICPEDLTLPWWSYAKFGVWKDWPGFKWTKVNVSKWRAVWLSKGSALSQESNKLVMECCIPLCGGRVLIGV